MNREEQWLLKEKYEGVESEAFHADCARLAAGEPLGYVIGHVPFLGCTIYLEPEATKNSHDPSLHRSDLCKEVTRPLIPRPETEWWVEKALAEITKKSKFESQTSVNRKVLDLCAGSGAIGVAVAKHIPTASVDFAEIDADLLPTIKKNLLNNIPNYSDQLKSYKIFQSNLFISIPTDTKYDFILTNPPYIDPILDRTQPSVKNFEPHIALYGGHNGTELIEKIITQSPTYLSFGGQLWIEHEPEQVAAITTLAAANHFSVTTHNDQFGIKRYSVLVLQ